MVVVQDEYVLDGCLSLALAKVQIAQVGHLGVLFILLHSEGVFAARVGHHLGLGLVFTLGNGNFDLCRDPGPVVQGLCSNLRDKTLNV